MKSSKHPYASNQASYQKVNLSTETVSTGAGIRLSQEVNPVTATVFDFDSPKQRAASLGTGHTCIPLYLTVNNLRDGAWK